MSQLHVRAPGPPGLGTLKSKEVDPEYHRASWTRRARESILTPQPGAVGRVHAKHIRLALTQTLLLRGPRQLDEPP